MSVSGGDLTGCSVLVYDLEGNHLSDTIVTEFDKNSMRIEVEEMPAALGQGTECMMLIMMSPTPFEFHGRVIKEGTKTAIALFKGHEKESRGATRYRVDHTATIEYLVCNSRAYPLHTPLEVSVMNISKSGVRFKTPFYAMTDGDRFQIRLKISGGEKQLIADVTNHTDVQSDKSEYGCRFLIGK